MFSPWQLLALCLLVWQDRVSLAALARLLGYLVAAQLPAADDEARAAVRGLRGRCAHHPRAGGRRSEPGAP